MWNLLFKENLSKETELALELSHIDAEVWSRSKPNPEKLKKLRYKAALAVSFERKEDQEHSLVKVGDYIAKRVTESIEKSKAFSVLAELLGPEEEKREILKRRIYERLLSVMEEEIRKATEKLLLRFEIQDYKKIDWDKIEHKREDLIKLFEDLKPEDLLYRYFLDWWQATWKSTYRLTPVEEKEQDLGPGIISCVAEISFYLVFDIDKEDIKSIIQGFYEAIRRAKGTGEPEDVGNRTISIEKSHFGERKRIGVSLRKEGGAGPDIFKNLRMRLVGVIPEISLEIDKEDVLEVGEGKEKTSLITKNIFKFAIVDEEYAKENIIYEKIKNKGWASNEWYSLEREAVDELSKMSKEKLGSFGNRWKSLGLIVTKANELKKYQICMKIGNERRLFPLTDVLVGEDDLRDFLKKTLGKTLGNVLYITSIDETMDRVVFGFSKKREMMSYDGKNSKSLAVLLAENTGRVMFTKGKGKSYNLQDLVRLRVYLY